MSSLDRAIRTSFWDELARNPGLDLSLKKLLASRSIPPERWDELKHTLYAVQCVGYANYNPDLSAFNTWMLNGAKALLRNYFRNNGGPRSPLSGDITESDLIDRGSPLDPFQASPFDLVEDLGFPNSDQLDALIAIYDVLRRYQENLADFSAYQAVFQTMLLYGFDVTDRQIGYEVELSYQKAHIIRQQILSELKSMFISRGIAPGDVDG